MNYEEAWQFLDDLQFFKIKLGLDSMEKFLSRLDNPHHKIKFVHVGGTNGKGSVSAVLQSILSCAGFKTGLFTSPHLSSVRERFRLDDVYISKQEFADIATEIRGVLHGGQITYFEFTTVMAMLWFVRRKVDLAILEVGMGGRLDATNVITPLVSIITNVSMDHEAYLGNTLREISREKAGIIKNRIPVVSAVAKDVSREVVETTCAERQSPLYLYGRDFEVVEGHDNTFDYQGINKEMPLIQLRTSLKGEYQRSNTGLALATLEILADHGYSCRENEIRNGLLQARWPGRLELVDIDVCASPVAGYLAACATAKPTVADSRNGRVLKRRFLLDGAHNPAGVNCLVQALAKEYSYENLVLIWGAMSDKDISATINTAAAAAGRIILTKPRGERSAAPEQILAKMSAAAREKTICIGDISDAICYAVANSSSGDLICIAGSLYLIGETRKLLCGDLVGDE